LLVIYSIGQKNAPSLKFWRFFTFLQLHQILTHTLQISTVFILALWELTQKKFSFIQGLEDDFILSQLKLKIVKHQNLQDWLSKPGK
jgi:hypothetical protein